MMQFASLKEITEGMCVAEDVCDDSGRVLIGRGQRLGHHHLSRLRKFRIESIFIDPENGESVVKPTKTELRNKCVEVLKKSFEQIGPDFAKKKVALDAIAIKEATSGLVEGLMKSKNPLVTLIDINAGPDKLMQHSVNTAVLATVLAIDRHVPEPMVKDLAAAMLFHDFGTMFLPDAVLQKPCALTPQEALLMRQHVPLGCAHLLQTDAISSVSANVILRHHELLDGSGYPEGRGGDKLSLLMQIACIAETYDTLTTGRPWMPPVLPDVALSYIIANAGRLFAKEVVISLCQRVALYPVGSAVQLNTGECGIVAGTLPKAPTRPALLVHVDHRGKTLSSPMIVDLMRDSQRSVVRSASTLPALLQVRNSEVVMRSVDPVMANLG